MTKSDFNLLPKEVFDQRKKSRKTVDRTSLFSAVLPLLAVIVWIAFIGLNYLVETQVKQVEDEITSIENEISTYQADKDKKSLLVLKTKVLKDIVRRDVNPENFFTIVQELVEDSGLEIQILTYGRNTDGKFYITASANTIPAIADINRIFRNAEQLNNVQLNDISKSGDELSNNDEFEITFNIEN